MADRGDTGRGGGGAADAALIPVCRLYPKTSAKGARYLTGRWGGARVLVLAKRDGDDGEHSHVLTLAEAPPAAASASGARRGGAGDDGGEGGR